MNVLYIWDADYPWDVRVEKVCRSLVQRGHEVHIAARNLKQRPIHEIVDEMHVHRLRPWKSPRWNYALSFPAFFSPIWSRLLNGVIREHSIDVVIVRDLPMVIAGLWAARPHGIPVVFDNAEDYVSMVRRMWNRAKFKGANLLVRNPFFAKLVERYALPRVDCILVVSEEMIEVCRRAGANPENVYVVGNTPPLATLEIPPSARLPDLSRLAGRWAAIYTGGLQAERGLGVVIEAMPSLVKEIPDFLFVMVGEGAGRFDLERKAYELGVQENVWFVGWVDHAEIYHYIRGCKVGVVPHPVDAHVHTTIPNKIYDYMACGVPVVATEARTMKRILRDVGAGVVFRSGDAEDFVRAILEVYRSEEDLGLRGAEAVRTRLNWAVDEKILIDAVERAGRRYPLGDALA